MGSEASAPRRGAKPFALAMFVAQLCAVTRYAVLARLLGPEQLGLAATLILTAQFFDTVTDSGGDRFIVQNPAGGEPRAQALVQLVALMRGAIVALALILASRPIAAFFREPALTGGLCWLALLPLLSGALHFDFRRRQRAHDFRDEARIVMVSEIAGLVLTVAAAFIVRDFTAVIYGVVGRAAAMMLMSHALADDRYRLGLSHEHRAALWRFGVPLVANGLLLFLGSQSDRLLIGRLSGLDELGRFSAILLPVLYPASMFIRFVGGLYLRRLAAGADDWTMSERELARVTLLASLALMVGFAIAAPFAIPLLFGPAFAAPALFMTLVGIYQATRMARAVSTTGALGIGRSDIVLAGNIARLPAIPLAILLFGMTRSPSGIVVGFVAGEILALLLAQALVSRAVGQGIIAGNGRNLLFLLASGALCLSALGHFPKVMTVLTGCVIMGVALFREQRFLRSVALARLRG